MLQSSITVSNERDTNELDLRALNARSLALSALLGTHPPELPARGLVALAELFGITGGAMRTALSRMAANGEVAADAGSYRLTGALVERQRSQDAGRRPPTDPWDGRWLSVVAAADQRDLAERRRFRATMHNHRLGELRPDIWMRPANQAPPPVDDAWIVLCGELDGADPVGLSRRLWDLGAVARTAAALDAELERLRSELDWADPSSIPQIFTASAAVVRFLRSEPQLPRELTPTGWPVGRLRRRYDGVESDLQHLLRAFLRDL
jgi:phenylacetic acid degradation operon negative regulatory protein